ncbi:hypothetical protein N6L24_06475 [Cognatishimia sp. SS12]|uniref:LPS assembly lipoprotein LptE n=1 Tax=Cognatishimia sp. SS12 TaxID=2979465 RepID=UPI00232B9ED5|nr:LPS assembly lipoprotein LptE [Cognatishimia sp. SS12]MDC0737916.1 hypothetical protein [Cognatishimia sp. SS12]
MSSFDRRSFLRLTAAPLLLAGCGFEPAFGPNGAARTLLGQVLVDEPTTSDGFVLTRQLEHRLGRAANPRYGLSVAITTEKEGVALTADNRTTRIDILGQATWALRALDSKEVLLSGKVDNFTGYSTTGATVSELAAERDARRRLMIILADQITLALTAQASELPA